MNSSNNKSKYNSNKNNNLNNKPQYNKYSLNTINDMNKSYPWNGTIRNSYETNNNRTANSNNILLATGDCDMNGRVYISVNSDVLNMTERQKEELKKKKNIIDNF